MSISPQTIAGQFALPGVLVSCAPLGSGLINDTYEVTTSSGKFVLQKINTSIFKDPTAVMKNISSVLNHRPLQEAFPQALTLISTADGAHFLNSPGGSWRCFKMVRAAHTIDVATSSAQAYEVANAFGTFQQALSSLPVSQLTETLPDFHNTPLRHRRLLALVSTLPVETLDPVADVLNFIEDRALLLDLLWQDKGTPLRIVHNDTKINNVMLSDADGTAACVIDLDTVMPGRSLYDFGDLVRTATASHSEEEQDLSKVHFRPDYYSAVESGYLDSVASTLTGSERSSLKDAGRVVTLELIIRFLDDHLRGDVYFQTDHRGQNLARARNQMRFIESMEAAQI